MAAHVSRSFSCSSTVLPRADWLPYELVHLRCTCGRILLQRAMTCALLAVARVSPGRPGQKLQLPQSVSSRLAVLQWFAAGASRTIDIERMGPGSQAHQPACAPVWRAPTARGPVPKVRVWSMCPSTNSNSSRERAMSALWEHVEECRPLCFVVSPTHN